MKTIHTLVEDIYSVIDDRGGWTEVVNEYFKETLGDTMMRRLGPEADVRDPTKLGMSSIGQPCGRKLWYSVNVHEKGEPLRPETKLKFLFGDILEDLLLSLAVAAGHKVEGQQDQLDIKGVKGHRDAVIDGVTIDVKSASSFSFLKFKDHNLENEDPFGYLSQLSSYVYAAKDDPIVEDKAGGAFLVIDKQHGKLCLDYYNFKKTGHFKNIEKLYEERINSVGKKSEPDRGFEDEPYQKSGNKKLSLNCSYCNFKHECWPGLRTFLYSRGPVYLTVVNKEPLSSVKEITND